MNKERLDKAIRLRSQIIELENYLESEHIEVNFITDCGTEHLDFINGTLRFRSDFGDEEDVIKIKDMITEYLNKKLNQYKKEFEEL